MADGPVSDGPRMSAGQLIGWGLALVVLLALLFMYFKYGSLARSLLGGLTEAAWLRS